MSFIKPIRIQRKVCYGSDPDESGTLPRTVYHTAGNASRPPPHLIWPTLTGRTPARIHTYRSFATYSSIQPVGIPLQSNAGAG
jgi:hypothetical protein